MTYRLRAEAKWHDGKPVTPDDVIFSLDAFKKHHPQYSAYYRHVAKAEKTGEREITFTFDEPGNRELPQIVGQLTVLPKHWWEGTDAKASKRDISATTLEPPLGSGAYRIKEFVAGRSIVYERVQGLLGQATSTSISAATISTSCASNISATRRSRSKRSRPTRSTGAPRTAPRTGPRPTISRRSRDKRVVLEEFPNRSSGIMQAFAFNIRRDKFKDPRVRRAFNFAFDFEEMNKQIFFGQYKRISSYFDGTELASSGLPQGKELEILETVRDKVPPEVFTTAYTNPVGGNPEAVRDNLREALRLLKEAGYEVRDRKLVNAKTGEPFSGRIAGRRSDLRAGHAVLQAVAGAARHRRQRAHGRSDAIREPAAQLGLRHRSSSSWGQSLSPGNEQREFWGSQAADRPGSRNYRRHQESGDRRADRARHLRQGPRRSGRRDQGARPRAAVEPLRRAAVDLSARSAPRAGTASAGPTDCRNTACRLSRRSGGGTPKRPPRSEARREGCSRMAQFCRRHVLGLGVGALALRGFGRRWRDAAQPKLHGLSAFGDLKYPGGFQPFRLRQSERRRAAMFSQLGPASATRLRPSIRSTPSSSRAMRRSGMELTFAALMARAVDEPDAIYRPRRARA